MYGLPNQKLLYTYIAKILENEAKICLVNSDGCRPCKNKIHCLILGHHDLLIISTETA